MQRYLVSLFFTVCIYVLLIGTYLYALDTNTPQVKTQKKDTKIRVLIHKEKPKIIEKKVIKKRILKKEVIKKQQQKPLKPQKEYVKKKPIKPLVKKKIEPEKVIKKEEYREEKKVVVVEDKEAQELYFKNIKQRINANKSYPRKAYKRNIQGNVKVNFTISPSGDLISFKIIKGHKYFKKSIAKAIESSFPYKPSKKTFYKNVVLELEIQYRLTE